MVSSPLDTGLECNLDHRACGPPCQWLTAGDTWRKRNHCTSPHGVGQHAGQPGETAGGAYYAHTMQSRHASSSCNKRALHACIAVTTTRGAAGAVALQRPVQPAVEQLSCSTTAFSIGGQVHASTWWVHIADRPKCTARVKKLSSTAAYSVCAAPGDAARTGSATTRTILDRH